MSEPTAGPTEPLRAQVAENGLVVLPPAVGEGEAPLPYGVDVNLNVTQPDAKGNQWVVMTITDGTVTASARIPFEVAEVIGIGIAQGMQQVVARARQQKHGGLVLPNQGGKLLIPNGNGRAR
jgi:hypothetical protein